jgi:hypothetical protein
VQNLPAGFYDQKEKNKTYLQLFTMPMQAIIQSSIEAVEIIDTPIPTPLANEVVIKVIVAGSNPKDWKYPLWYVLVV